MKFLSVVGVMGVLAVSVEALQPGCTIVGGSVVCDRSKGNSGSSGSVWGAKKASAGGVWGNSPEKQQRKPAANRALEHFNMEQRRKEQEERLKNLDRRPGSVRKAWEKKSSSVFDAKKSGSVTNQRAPPIKKQHQAWEAKMNSRRTFEIEKKLGRAGMAERSRHDFEARKGGNTPFQKKAASQWEAQKQAKSAFDNASKRAVMGAGNVWKTKGSGAANARAPGSRPL